MNGRQAMENLENIALFIDAENISYTKLEGIIEKISANGRIVVKRAYGDWTKKNLAPWREQSNRPAVKPCQQFSYVSGKNAVDMALTIDAVELLHKEIYDMFVIASSDSDYTPLAIHLRESGAYVVGVGEKKTPESFQHSCDEFIFLEEIPEKQMEPNPPSGAAAKAQAENEGTDTDKSDACGELHKLLEEIWESCSKGNDPYVLLSVAGKEAGEKLPDFKKKIKSLGCKNLSGLVGKFPPKYDLKKEQTKKGATIYYYKCKK